MVLHFWPRSLPEYQDILQFLYLVSSINHIYTSWTIYYKEAPGLEIQLLLDLLWYIRWKCFQAQQKKFFGALDDINLFILKFHTLQKIAKSLQRFSDVWYLDAFTFKYFNFVIKWCLQVTSIREGSILEKSNRQCVLHGIYVSEKMHRVPEKGQQG